MRYLAIYTVIIMALITTGCGKKEASSPETSQDLTTQEEIESTPETAVRNPFGVPDVAEPTGADLQAFAANTTLPGDDQDLNAETWVDIPVTSPPESLEGEWSSRWSGGSARSSWVVGTSKVSVDGDTVYILSSDPTGTYIIEATREDDLLIGRYQNISDAEDTSTYVGRIVDNQRIDGAWANGRWDLRR